MKVSPESSCLVRCLPCLRDLRAAGAEKSECRHNDIAKKNDSYKFGERRSY